MTVTTPAPLAPRQAAALLETMPIILRAELEAAPEALHWRSTRQPGSNHVRRCGPERPTR